MSILEDIQTTINALDIPIETGVFSNKAPEKYIVVIPLSDTFELMADNMPQVDVQEARLSVFCKGSYTKMKNQIIQSLLVNDFTITARQYIGYETDTGYHHYNVDVAKFYNMEEF